MAAQQRELAWLHIKSTEPGQSVHGPARRAPIQTNPPNPRIDIPLSYRVSCDRNRFPQRFPNSHGAERCFATCHRSMPFCDHP